MDHPVVKLEARYDELEYGARESYIYPSFPVKYENEAIVGGYIHGCQALPTVKLEPNEYVDKENQNAPVGREDNTNAQRLALEKAKSLAASSFFYSGTKTMGKDNATDFVAHYHNCRLRDILAELISQHRWKESTGVLSVWLKGSVNDNYFFRHQCKYLAAMEILRQVEGVEGNATRFKRMYRILMNKLPTPKHAINKKLQLVVQLELALHLIVEGDYNDARETTKLLVQMPEFRDDPVANMVHGLILHQHWYASVIEELQLGHCDVNALNALSERMETDFLENSNNSSESVRSLHGHLSRESSKNKKLMLLDSDSSVGNAKESPKGSGEHSSRKRQRCAISHHGVLKHHVRGFYEGNSGEVSLHDEGSISKEAIVLSSSGLDRRLFPIQLPRPQEHVKYIIPMESDNVRDSHLDALKHFRVALSSSPPILAALLPFLQLLLANGQSEEAMKEIEKFCQASNHLVPFILKARLLESLSLQNPLLLARCYEKILEKNPASVRSIKCLTKLHRKGDYQTESLVEYLALHLDATHGTMYIWSELSSCFMKMQVELQSEHERDRISTQQNLNISDVNHQPLTQINQFPKIFLKSELRSTWRLRCRWWRSRHFDSKSIYLDCQEIGDWECMTFKAACACHIYGPKFGYVNDIYAALEKKGDDNMLSILKSHIQFSLKLLEWLSSND